ncbi:MAG TPA: FliM/FliN family flagellar motor C-terminal domain-containing protein [Candidatus Aquilonibacter sp.]|nr:FliM/FliN family flagellar motor C-terminal domain-containing protein [Candidatus Aquilonibacter sp.]
MSSAIVAATTGNGQTAQATETSVKADKNDHWADAGFLPCRLSAEVDIAKFTVRDLFCLEVDSVLDTGWVQSIDVPLRANSQLLGWVEFEVIGERLAVRLTELY